MGPDTWTDPLINCTLGSDGVLTIENNMTRATYFKVKHIANEVYTDLEEIASCRASMYNEDTNDIIGASKDYNSYTDIPSGTHVSTTVYLSVLISVPANGQYRLSVRYKNGLNNVNIDTNTNPAILEVDRVV
jgi:plasmid maintenance system killer protein